MYERYPIEQLVTSRRFRYQIGFARITIHMAPHFTDALLASSWNGLRILAESECALVHPRMVIRRMHDEEIELDSPRVRFVDGIPAQEPIMKIVAQIPEENMEIVISDLITRNARIEDTRCDSSSACVEAVAPLRNLLGYKETLGCLTGERGEVQMRLSHYAPMHDGSERTVSDIA